MDNLRDHGIPRVGIFKDSKPAIDFSSPFATKSSLSQYYSCGDCNALWQEVNKEFNYECKFCDSENIKNVEEDEYFDMVKGRLEPDEVADLESEQDSEEVYHMANIQNYKQYVN